MSSSYLPLALIGLLLLSCGYRPVGGALSDAPAQVSVVAFRSHLAHPQLDIHGARYLSRRLSSLGLMVVDQEHFPPPVVIRGTLISAVEYLETLGPTQELVSFEVTTDFVLEDGQGWICRTPARSGKASAPLALGRAVDLERAGALQTATEASIEASLLDLIVCLEESGASQQPDNGGGS